MAFDQTGAMIGGVGHDAAVIVAAEITAGELNIDDALAEYESIRSSLVASTLLLQAEANLSQGGIASAPSQSGGFRPNNPNAKPAGGDGTAGSLVYRSGKHEGKTIAQVEAIEPEYHDWAVGNLKNDFMRKKIEEFRAAA